MTEPVTLSREELRDIVRAAVREELRAVGLHTDDPDHSDAVRDDIRFAGKMRRTIEGLAGKVGMAIVLAIIGGIISLITLGAHSLIKG